MDTVKVDKDVVINLMHNAICKRSNFEERLSAFFVKNGAICEEHNQTELENAISTATIEELEYLAQYL